MKIVSWNVNSIRVRRPLLEKLIADENPDFILLQETRTSGMFPTINGYHIAVNEGSISGRNGVAILSKTPVKLVNLCTEGRYIEIFDSISNLNLICVYVPNGGSISSSIEHKIIFFNKIIERMKNASRTIIAGDFNVVYKDSELTMINPFGEIEINLLKEFEKYVNFIFQKNYITWWDYREGAFFKNLGLGIDKFFFSKDLTPVNTEILKQYRREPATSDHCPIKIIFKDFEKN